MKQVKVEVIIDTRDTEQVNALNNLLVVIGRSEAPFSGTNEEEIPEAPKTEKQQARKGKNPGVVEQTESKKETEEPRKEVEDSKKEIEEPEKETGNSEKEEAAEKTYTVEEVRQILKDKVSDHREEIKSKLSELDAPNVSSLNPDKYTEFVDFLNSLS